MLSPAMSFLKNVGPFGSEDRVFNFRRGHRSKFLSYDPLIWSNNVEYLKISLLTLANQYLHLSEVLIPLEFSIGLSEFQGVYVVLYPELYEEKQ